jgi:hypothetical protein
MKLILSPSAIRDLLIRELPAVNPHSVRFPTDMWLRSFSLNSSAIL